MSDEPATSDGTGEERPNPASASDAIDGDVVDAVDVIDGDVVEATDGDEKESDVAAQEIAAEPPPMLPIVTRLEPAIADARGGTPIAAFGAGFRPGCTLFVGDEERVAELVDGFTMRFVAPSGSGEAIVSVETPDGERGEGFGVALRFVEGPRIDAVVPAVVPLEGGVEVALEGARFVEGTTVTLFDAVAVDLVVQTGDRLTFVAPPNRGGAREGSIVLTTPDGLVTRLEGALRYRELVPSVTSVEPAHGWTSGGKRVSVSGVDFHPRAVVDFGSVRCEAKVRSDARIDVEVPPSDGIGPVDVVVTNPDGRKASLTGGFRYEPVPTPPKIIDLFPREGSTVGGATIRVRGENFSDSLVVRLGELTAVRRVLTPALVDFDLPPRALPGRVALELQDGDVVVRLEDAFTYVSPKAPVLSSLEPRSGPLSGGTKVVIEGTGFVAGASVRFGSESCKSVVVRSAERLEVVTPAVRDAGLVDVVVISSETGPGTAKAAFRYEAPLVPVIKLVAPTKGTTLGGTELSVEGSGFAEGAVVLVGGKPAKTRRISGSVLEAETPPGSDGQLVDVAVKNPSGREVVQKRAFQYDARYRS